MIPIHTAFSFWGRVPMQPLLLFDNYCLDQADLGLRDNSSDYGVLGLKAGHPAQLTHSTLKQTLGIKSL